MRVEERFSFEGVEAVEARILKRAREATYIAMRDRTDREQDESVGRFDLTVEDARPYLLEDAEPSPPAEDSLEADLRQAVGGEAPEGKPPEQAPGSPPAEQGPTPEGIARAACRWLRDTAIRNTFGDEWRRFKVLVYGPKGMHVLDTGTFLCRNHDFEAPVELPKLPEMKRSPDDAVTEGWARSVRVIGDLYAQFATTVLGSLGHLQGVNNSMLHRLQREVLDGRGQVDQLLGALLDVRFKVAQAEAEAVGEDRQAAIRADMAKEALRQVGDVARAFFAAKGIPPELADLFGQLTASPELMDALKDPVVRQLLGEPSHQKDLAALLKAVAAKAKAAAEAADAGSGTPPPQSPPPSSQPAAGA